MLAVSNIFDTLGVAVTLAQRSIWAELVWCMALLAGLGIWLAVTLAHAAPADVELTGMGTVATVGAVVLLAGRTWARAGTQPGDEIADERDREVARRADALTLQVAQGLMLVTFALGLVGAGRFWLVVALYAATLLVVLANGVIRLVLYARG